MKKSILHYLQTLIVFVIVAFGSITFLKSQSFLKPMDNGLKAPVNASCEDSLGNFYALSYSFGNDTVYINQWNAATKKWSVYTRLAGIYNSSTNAITAYFLYGKLYVTGRRNTTNLVDLMEFNGTWKRMGSFRYNFSYTALNAVKFKNRIYYSGPFDSISGTAYKSIVAFNGSGFSDVGFPYTGYSEAVFAVSNDTLYANYNEKILLHKSPNTWSVYHTNTSTSGKYYFNGLAVKNYLVYATVYNGNSGNQLDIIDKGKVVDSVLNPNNSRMFLNTFNNQLFISTSTDVLYVKNKKDIKFLFKNQNSDTSRNPFFAGQSNLYYYGSGGVKVNGVDYKNIVEILVDSLKPVGYDTIRGTVFWDKNNDYVPNGGDVYPNYGYVHNITEDRYVMFNPQNSGRFKDIVLADRNATYSVEQYYFDSCVQQGYSGNISASNTNTGITADTIYFPMTRPTSASKNLVLRSYSNITARMLDTIELAVLIRNKDCYYNATTNATVRVSLAPNTVFVSASPSPASNSGNNYVFSNLTLNYGADNFIKIKVVYPNTKFKLGDRVKHSARLDKINNEDTMDNLDSIRQIIVYSYDPNAKHSTPEGRITTDLKNIRYHIDFQNLGNSDARKVTVVDTINLKIPVYEFRMVAASHNYSVSIAPGTNIVTWVFDNINLKPKTQNEAASKGYIIFDAKLIKNVKVGDSIRNRAYIYFDYNEPVITNFAVVNRVDQKENVNLQQFVRSTSLNAYPNPGQDFVNFENTISAVQQIAVYDLKGARVMQFELAGNETKRIATGNWAKGLYMVVNEKGEGFKIIIE